MRGFMVVLLWLNWMILMGAAVGKRTRLLQQEHGDQRDNQCGAEQIEGVAEGQDKSLLLHDLADGYDGAVGGCGVIDDAVVHEILRQLLDPRPGGVLE